ncbi:MAG: MCP four helix bundle domain-containing protein [Thermodesulfobacteriota bacterium]|nr:MCP four helix bundle domain-containing protein [Thermodesulfobacteriota bacterium]
MSLTIKTKLIAGFSCLLVLLAIIAALSLNKLSGMNERINGIVDVSAEKIKLAARINQGVLAISRAEKNILLATTREEMDEYFEFIDQTQAEMDQRHADLEKLVDADGRSKLATFEKTWGDYQATSREVRDMARENGSASAFDLASGEGRKHNDAAMEQIAAIVDYNEAMLALDKAASDQSYAFARNTILGLTVFAILFAVGIVFYIVRDLC